MDDFLLRLAKDFGFPALVAVYVLVRLDRRLAHVEHCLVRICAILSATTGVRVEDLDEPAAHEGEGVDPLITLNEPSKVQPVPTGGAATNRMGGGATSRKGDNASAGEATQGG